MNKKQTFVKCIALLSTLLLLTGCHKQPSDALSENEIDTSAETILRDALSLYNQNPLRATETTYVSTYTDGSHEEETETLVYDSANELLKTAHTYANGDHFENILVKEGSDVYSFVKDTSIGENWIRYFEVPDANNETPFEYLLQEFDFSITEENGYSNIIIEHSGTDILNGNSCIKLNISATLSATDGMEDVDEDEIAAKVTREDIMLENEWTEESVNAIDGFSELLDEYVKYLNQPSDMPEASEEKYTIWIAEDSSQILQIEGLIKTNYSEEAVSDVEEEFWNRCWEVSWIQADLDSGVSLEDSLMYLEFERDIIEAQIEDNMEMESDGEDEMELSLIEMSFVRTFLSGDSCPEIKLPDDFTETTLEDYYSEFADE